MLTILNATNLRWNQTQQAIDCDVFFAEIQGVTPFTANPDDQTPHGRELYAAAIAGVYGEIAPYVDPRVLQDSAFPTPPSGEIPVVLF